MKTTSTPGLRRIYVNLKKADWDRYRQEEDTALSKHSLPTDCQRDEKYSSTQSSVIPHPYWTTQTPRGTCISRDIGCDDLRKRDPTSPELPRLTYRTASTHTKGKHEEILLRPSTRRQMSPSCGELLKELFSAQYVKNGFTNGAVVCVVTCRR